MMRTAIHILAVVSIALAVSGLVWLVGLSIGLDKAQALCTQEDPVRTAACADAASARFGVPIAICVLVLVVGCIAGFVVWILALAKTAGVGAWGWFVSVLLFPALGPLLYGIAGPDQHKAPRVVYVPVQGMMYPPGPPPAPRPAPPSNTQAP